MWVPGGETSQVERTEDVKSDVEACLVSVRKYSAVSVGRCRRVDRGKTSWR